MSIGPEEVRRTAALAGLRLTPREEEELAGQLATILEHAQALAAAVDSGVGHGSESTAGGETGGRAPLRDDELGADSLAESAARMAPEWVDGFFTVPRLPSHEPPEGRSQDAPGGS